MNDNTPQDAASLEEQGKSLFRSKQYLEAADRFSQAAGEAAARGAITQAAEMRNNQAVALLLAGKPGLAEDALQGTSEVFRDAGDAIKRGMALANQATARKDQGKLPAALEDFSQAAEIFRDAGSSQLYLETMQSISALKLRSRDLAGAVYAMRSGLAAIPKPTWRQKLLHKFLDIPYQLLNR